jgi:hypothetical protein
MHPNQLHEHHCNMMLNPIACCGFAKHMSCSKKNEFVFQGFFISIKFKPNTSLLKDKLGISSLLPIALAHQRFVYIKKKIKRICATS